MTHFLVATGGLIALVSSLAGLWIDWKTYQLRKKAMTAVTNKED